MIDDLDRILRATPGDFAHLLVGAAALVVLVRIAWMLASMLVWAMLHGGGR